MKKLNEIKRASIFGTGARGEAVYCELSQEIHIDCFYDNFSESKELDNVPILKYSKKIAGETIIVASDLYWKEIMIQLVQMGNKPFEDFFPYEVFVNNNLTYEKLRTIGKISEDNADETISRFAYSITPQRIAVIYGNCQNAKFYKILNLYEEYNENFFNVEVPAVFEWDNIQLHSTLNTLIDDDDFWKNIGLFIYQKVNIDNKVSSKLATSRILDKLNPQAKKVRIDNIFFDGYFPQISSRYSSLLGFSKGNTLFRAGDINIEAMVCNGNSSSQSIYNSLSKRDYYSKTKIFYKCNKSIGELKRREKESDVYISDYIEKHFCDYPLFYSPNHPSNAVLIEYSRRIMEYLFQKSYKMLKFDSDLDEALLIGSLRGQDIPIYPSVQNIIFGNVKEYHYFINRYFYPEIYVTFREYVDRYVDVLYSHLNQNKE